jgi:hypothetical protein
MTAEEHVPGTKSAWIVAGGLTLVSAVGFLWHRLRAEAAEERARPIVEEPAPQEAATSSDLGAGRRVQASQDLPRSSATESTLPPTIAERPLDHIDLAMPAGELVARMHAFRRAPHEDGLAALRALAASSDPMVVRGVILSLAAVGPQLAPASRAAALATLVDLYERFEEDRVAEARGHRMLIIAALADVGDEAGMDFLGKLIDKNQRDLHMLYLIAKSLSRMPDSVDVSGPARSIRHIVEEWSEPLDRDAARTLADLDGKLALIEASADR